MTNKPKTELQTLDDTVEKVLTYFETSGARSRGRVGEWGAWEVLCHFIFWHEVTIEGVESVARGGGPFRAPADADTLNAKAIARYRGTSLPDLVACLRRLHPRLKEAVRKLPSLDAIVVVRRDSTTQSARERLKVIANHWTKHTAELQAAEPR